MHVRLNEKRDEEDADRIQHSKINLEATKESRIHPLANYPSNNEFTLASKEILAFGNLEPSDFRIIIIPHPYHLMMDTWTSKSMHVNSQHHQLSNKHKKIGGQ